MSEDYIFNRNQKKEGERKVAPDIFGSLGKGMLAKENLETLSNSSGLTPLGIGVNVRDRVLNNSANEGIPTTETLQNSPGLVPIRPFGEIHNENLKNSSLDEVFSDTGILGNSSGLTPLCPGSKIDKRRVIE